MDDAIDAVLGDHASTRFSSPASPMNSGTLSGRKAEKPVERLSITTTLFAGVRQRAYHVTSNIAGAAGDKHSHEITRLPFEGKLGGRR